jgi:glycosyltransferase involved in cell wall biosynthesis
LQGKLSELLGQRNHKQGNLVSIVLPLFNEEESLPVVLAEFFGYLSVNLPDYRFEITFVDDCSSDRSYEIITDASSGTPENIKLSVVQLAKNSGSHVAITAGINIARGDFIIIMASDGQDPVSVISELLSEWKAGSDLILASRKDNLDQSGLAKNISRLAWKLMNWSTNIKMPETGCDLLGMDRKVADAFNRMDERNTTFIFRILSLGFKQKEIQYIKRSRVGGTSKWTFLKKLAIMFDAITGFSSRPLRLITKLGLILFFVLMMRWVYVVADIYVFNHEPTDLTIILNTIFSILAILVLIIGMVGDYIWRILDETRKRPLYEIRKSDGKLFDDLKNQ